MKSMFFIIGCIVMLCSCAAFDGQWSAPEYPAGKPIETAYRGDCVDDHFDHYWDCMNQQFGGSGDDSGDGE